MHDEYEQIHMIDCMSTSASHFHANIFLFHFIGKCII